VTVPSGPDTARDVAANHVSAVGGSIAYESPEAVLADDSLERSQKLRFLQEWREALADHLGGDEVAAEDAPAEAELKARIDRALETLGGG
jgi:hypothetical protein